MEKYPIIRTIYLYLFALVGLALLTIGTARLIDLGLKAYVFTKADIEDVSMPPMPSPYFDQNIRLFENLQNCQDKCNLTLEQKQQITNWLEDYKKWQKGPKVSYQTSSRHRQASSSLSMIIVGLPLYLYHWITIKEDIKRKKEENI